METKNLIVNHEEVKGKHIYTHDGLIVRRSKREYRYALLGIARKSLGASGDGVKYAFIGLGNKADSLVSSWRSIKYYMELKVVGIHNI